MKAVNNFKKGTQKKWFRDNYVKPGAGERGGAGDEGGREESDHDGFSGPS